MSQRRPLPRATAPDCRHARPIHSALMTLKPRKSNKHAPPPPLFHEADLRAPNALMLLLEGRAPWEYAAMIAALPWLKRLPRGDGHPVIVFPGLGAADITTAPLRSFLQDLGYSAYPWKQGFNFGPRRGVLDAVRAPCAAHRRAPRRAGEPGRLEPRRRVRARDGQGVPQARALRHHARLAVCRPSARDQRLALLRDVQRPDRARSGVDRAAARALLRCRRRRSTRAPTASSPGSAASTTSRRWPKTSKSMPATSAWA